MREFIIYCDGACSGNPGPGGWAALIKEEGCEGYFKQLINGADHTTNNQMELAAVIGSLRFLSEEPCKIDVYSDSEYLVKGMSEWLKNWKLKGWKTASKKPVSNIELWQELDELSSIHNITWQWTKGHADCEENNRVDELAYNEAQRRKNTPRN